MYITAKRNRAAFLGLIFVAVPLLPALYIPAVGENVFAERYLYLPSAGFALLMGLLSGRLRASKPAASIAVSSALALLLIFYCVKVIDRNGVWRDNYSLWADILEKSPDGAVPHGNFGYVLLSYPQRLDEAMGHLETAIRLGSQSYPKTGRVNMSSFYNNLGIAYSEKGWEDRAVKQYQTAIALNPSYVNAYNNLGVSYLESGPINEGIELFHTALRLQPDLAETHNNLGIALLKLGMREEAVAQFEEAVRLEPGDAGFYYSLADAYRAKGSYERAEEAMRRAKSLEGRGS
jgi:tetratricopeptide (TPR) repeat protein